MAINSLKKEDLEKRVDSLHCKGLCQECCGPIPFPKRLRDEYPGMNLPGNPFRVYLKAVRLNGYDCPFLKEGKCSIYEKRPAICHLWGNTEELQCPHGCEREGPLLTKKEGYIYLRQHGEGTI